MDKLGNYKHDFYICILLKIITFLPLCIDIDDTADKFYSLVQSYPQLKDNYGLFTGIGFDVPFARSAFFVIKLKVKS